MMVTSLTGCGFYSAEPITARVVDAETGLPLEGVNVVAAWRIEGGMNYGDTVGYMNVMETVTDKSGRFHFPGWGPRPNTHTGKVRLEAPGLMFFKSGYRYEAVENQGDLLGFAPSEMKSSWDGEVIAMKRFRGTAKEYEASLLPLGGDIFTLSRQNRLSDLPKFICSLTLQRETFLAQGVGNVYSIPQSTDEGMKCHQQ
jgi:hypothetical protein